MSPHAPCNVGLNGACLATSGRPSRVAAVAEALRLEVGTTTSRQNGAVMRPHVPRRPDRSAIMRRCNFSIPTTMGERIHKLALDATRLLGCTVSHAALFRAALLPWIEKAEGSSLVNTHEEIRRAAPLYGTLLQSCKPAFSKELTVKLEGLRKKLGGELCRYAAEGRSPLVLAALTPLLEAADRDLGAALERIRVGIVKRGRKPNQ